MRSNMYLVRNKEKKGKKKERRKKRTGIRKGPQMSFAIFKLRTVVCSCMK